MKRIGLLGAPGAGKSDLALALAEELKPKPVIIDDYVSKVENRVDLKLGFDATYIGNMHVALEREARERKAGYKDPAYIITCGTIYETSAYTAIGFENDGQLLTDEQNRDELVLRIEATMRFLAALYMDTFHYDLCFHLPVASEDRNIDFLERNIQTAYGAFELTKVIRLDDPEERVAQVLEALA